MGYVGLLELLDLAELLDGGKNGWGKMSTCAFNGCVPPLLCISPHM